MKISANTKTILAALENDRIAAVKSHRTRVMAATGFIATGLAAAAVAKPDFFAGHLSIIERAVSLGAYGQLAPYAMAAILLYSGGKLLRKALMVPLTRVQAKIKSDILSSLCETLKLNYEPGGLRDVLDDALSCSALRREDRRETEDGFSGVHKGVPFSFTEVRTYTRVKRRDKPDTFVLKFGGVVVRLRMNKNFKGLTIVNEQGWFNRPHYKLERVRLEDVDFENVFDAWGEDQVEARYILTPRFMEQLLALKRGFGGSSIACSFNPKTGDIIIPIQTQQAHFEIDIRRHSARDAFKHLVREIRPIVKIVDILKLDEQHHKASDDRPAPTASEAKG